MPPDAQNAEVEHTRGPGWCAVPEPGGQAGEIEDRGNGGKDPEESHVSPPAGVLAGVGHHLPRIGHRLRTHPARHEQDEKHGQQHPSYDARRTRSLWTRIHTSPPELRPYIRGRAIPTARFGGARFSPAEMGRDSPIEPFFDWGQSPSAEGRPWFQKGQTPLKWFLTERASGVEGSGLSGGGTIRSPASAEGLRRPACRIAPRRRPQTAAPCPGPARRAARGPFAR